MAVADGVLVSGAVVGVDKSVLVRVIVALCESVGNHKSRTSNHYQQGNQKYSAKRFVQKDE